MAKRLKRWLLATVGVTGVVFALAGNWRDPWLWAYALIWAATSLYGILSIDDDLARERFRPPTPGADRLSLRAVRIVAFAHLVVGALDEGRWHLTPPVPGPVRAAALAGMALSFALVFRAMRENRFFSAVVRVQSERGHRVVDSGPYAIVRHPGYAGMIVGVPLSGIALGSWVSFAIALVYAALILRRVQFEDGYLKQELAGYSEYAQRTRSRLLPGIW